MIEDVDAHDGQWRILLSRCHAKVGADGAFRASLLEELKAKARAGAEAARDVGGDENWFSLFAHSYEPCEPGEGFKSRLLRDLRDGLRRRADTHEETAIKELLAASYDPVLPRREFETRLLCNLKERQQTQVMHKRNSRRRSIRTSFISAFAAAAAVLFIVWSGSAGIHGASSFSDTERAAATAESQNTVAAYSEFKAGPVAGGSAAEGVATATVVAAAAPVETAFASRLLPKTAVGLGVELNDGTGWKHMDEAALTRIASGMSFRSADSTAILDFDDGSNVLLRPGAVIHATENGLDVERGELAVSVPSQTGNSLRFQLAGRELAVQPGTMLAVQAHNPDKYAVGGAPAPEVMVADGGLAFAKGRGGVGPLFANHAYLIDNYVTPDIPGRPMFAVECESMEKDFAPAFGDGQNQMPQMVSAPATMAAPRTPTGYRKDGRRLVADTYDGEETVRMRYLSDEYFGLADSRRDLAPALALGPELVIDGGGVFYEIFK